MCGFRKLRDETQRHGLNVLHLSQHIDRERRISKGEGERRQLEQSRIHL